MDKANLLFSFALFQKQRAVHEVLLPLTDVCRVMIDSGAFSNYSGDMRELKGFKRSLPRVTLDAYIEACKLWHGHVWQYVALDEIRNPARSTQNLTAMLDAGLVPMPVFIENDADALARLPDYMAINEHLCVAGGVKVRADYIHHRYQQIYQASDQQAKIHALGYTRWPTTFQLPLASCDSSTFASGSQYGWMPVYTRTHGFKRARWQTLDTWQTDPLRRQIVQFMRQCQVPFEVLRDPDQYKGTTGLPALFFILGYLNFMRHAAEYDIYLFLAVSNISWADAIAGVWATWDGEHIDYPASKAMYDELIALRRSDRAAYVNLLVQTYERRPVCVP